VILLSVGTESFSFARLVRAIDAAAPEFDEPFFAQIGTSDHLPVHMEYERLVSFERMRELMTAASRVVCHAGAGTTLLAMSFGHVPVVLPRLGAHGEHVDDHQVAFAERLADRGLLLCARDACEAVELLRRAPVRDAARDGVQHGRELSDHLLRRVGEAARRRRAA